MAQWRLSEQRCLVVIECEEGLWWYLRCRVTRSAPRLTTDFVATVASATGGIGERSVSVSCWKTFTGLTKYRAFWRTSLPNGTHDTRATVENMAARKWSWNNLRWTLTLLNFHGGGEETQTLDSGRSACGLGFGLQTQKCYLLESKVRCTTGVREVALTYRWAAKVREFDGVMNSV